MTMAILNGCESDLVWLASVALRATLRIYVSGYLRCNVSPMMRRRFPSVVGVIRLSTRSATSKNGTG